MKTSKPKIKKLLTFILTGLILLFNSCDDFNGEEIQLLESASAEDVIPWIDQLNQIDLNSEIAFVQNGESIQDAIDASLSGDRIYIEPGNYPGKFTNNKPDVKLIGLSISPNDMSIKNSKANNLEILKLYDQKSIHDFQKKSPNKGTDDFIFDISRTELEDGIVHYQFKVRVGYGEYEVIGVHRVVREEYMFKPIQTVGNIVMLHGAISNFDTAFFSSGLESNSEINAYNSSPVYMASKNIDVWGIDLAWTMIPSGTTDFGFLNDWGFEKDAYHTRIAMLIARFGRGLTGQGFSGLNLLGYSSGNVVAYAAANWETQQPNMMKRHIKGIVTADNDFKNENMDVGCESANEYMGYLNAGQMENRFGEFFNWLAYLATTDANGDSPVISGLTNIQALRVVVSAPEAPDKGIFFHFYGGNYNEFFYSDENRVVHVLEDYSPFMPTQIWYEFFARNCSSLNVTFDDYLNLIAVPIYNIGMGGGAAKFGFYTGTLTASNDITNHFISLNDDPAKDFGHCDLWTSDYARGLVWTELCNWIIMHN